MCREHTELICLSDLLAYCQVHRPSAPDSSRRIWVQGQDVSRLYSSSGSPPGVAGPREHVAEAGDGSDWHDLGRVLLASSGGAGCCYTPCSAQDSPTPQDKANRVVNRAQLETPALRRARGRPADLPPGGLLWLFPSTFSAQLSPSTVYPGAPTCVCTHTCPTIWH